MFQSHYYRHSLFSPHLLGFRPLLSTETIVPWVTCDTSQPHPPTKGHTRFSRTSWYLWIENCECAPWLFTQQPLPSPCGEHGLGPLQGRAKGGQAPGEKVSGLPTLSFRCQVGPTQSMLRGSRDGGLGRLPGGGRIWPAV